MQHCLLVLAKETYYRGKRDLEWCNTVCWCWCVVQTLFVVVVCACACVHASVVRLVQILACDITYTDMHAAHHVSTFVFLNGRPVRGSLSATRNTRDSLQCQKRPTTVSKETYYSVKRDDLFVDLYQRHVMSVIHPAAQCRRATGK